jgi:phytoene desaturase
VMAEKHIVIVGAGPGGLTAAMLLSHRGYRVTVVEREDGVGGRNRAIFRDGYTFDTGPTFLMMDFILREVFTEAGADPDQVVDFMHLDPMYKLSFVDKELFPTTDHHRMQEQLSRHFPGSERGLVEFMRKEKIRFDKMYPCLQRPYDKPTWFLAPPLVKAYPYLSMGKSLFQNLGRYFPDDENKIAFTFQAKYLGMSPWECPALFTIIPYVEHAFGIYHTRGGLSRISDAMADVAGGNGAEIHCSSPVDRILVKNRTATGVRLENGDTIEADAVVINADFGYAAANLFEPGVLRKYTPQKLRKFGFSCSTFMLYLGLDTLYDEPHHNIIFAENYRDNIDDISTRKVLSDDMSIYVRNASINDPTLAPKGHSALYVLVPVPNTSGSENWTEELTQRYREKVLDRICKRTSMHDLRRHIVTEYCITPRDWEQERNLFIGSTFNLAHTLLQMLYFRPHNKFEEVNRCYLVGGGTHPGSGLPTIYESARISSALIEQQVR